MEIFAIDPGPEHSGWLQMTNDKGIVAYHHETANMALLDQIKALPRDSVVVVEYVEARGKPVGQGTLDTAFWCGRFAQAGPAFGLLKPRQIRIHFCGTSDCKRPHVRQAIIDHYPRTGGGTCPQKGTKKKPGPLYGVSSHTWSALAIALCWYEKHNETHTKEQ